MKEKILEIFEEYLADSEFDYMLLLMKFLNSVGILKNSLNGLGKMNFTATKGNTVNGYSKVNRILYGKPQKKYINIGINTFSQFFLMILILMKNLIGWDLMMDGNVVEHTLLEEKTCQKYSINC